MISKIKNKNFLKTNFKIFEKYKFWENVCVFCRNGNGIFFITAEYFDWVLSNLNIPICTHAFGWELWRTPVILLLGGQGCWTVWGRGFCLALSYVDRVSALSWASIWWLQRRLGFPGCIKRDVLAQGGNTAGKSSRV